MFICFIAQIATELTIGVDNQRHIFLTILPYNWFKPDEIVSYRMSVLNSIHEKPWKSLISVGAKPNLVFFTQGLGGDLFFFSKTHQRFKKGNQFFTQFCLALTKNVNGGEQPASSISLTDESLGITNRADNAGIEHNMVVNKTNPHGYSSST